MFSGSRITLVGGICSFKPSIAGLGIKTIYYTYINTAGCSIQITNTINVIKVPNQPIIKGNASSCTKSGNYSVYTNSTPLISCENAFWSITSGAGTVTNANAANATISWSVLPAKLKLTITNSGLCTSTTTFNVAALLPATITGTTTACTSQIVNASKTYSTTLSTNQTSLWQIIGGAGSFNKIGVDAVIITWTTLPAILKLTVTQQSGCSVTTTLNITSLCTDNCDCLDDLTTYGAVDILHTGGTFIYVIQTNLADTCDGLVNFNFDYCDGTTGTSGVHCYNNGITYNVICTATMANGCSIIISFPVNGFPCVNPPPCLGCGSSKINLNALKEESLVISNYSIEVYPNPTNGLLNIKINNYVGKVNIQVVDINGRIVNEVKNEDFNSEKELNLNNLQSGIYIVKITGDDLNFTQKVIKN